jgi:hypothetical protein
MWVAPTLVGRATISGSGDLPAAVSRLAECANILLIAESRNAQCPATASAHRVSCLSSRDRRYDCLRAPTMANTARQPTLLQGPSSSGKHPCRCRSHANGDVDDGPIDWRFTPCIRGRCTRAASVHHITGRFITTQERLITFFSIACLNEYFQYRKRSGREAPKFEWSRQCNEGALQLRPPEDLQ